MADQVKIKAGIESSGIKSGLAKIKSEFAGLRKFSAGRIGSAIGAIGLTTAATSGLRSLVDQADQLQDLSDKLGVSAEALQMLGNVSKKSGGSLEDVSGALGKLLVAQAKVKKGDEGMIQSLAALGISQNEFIGLSPDEAFLRIADAVSKSNDDSVAYAATLDLMGRNAGNLFATLKQGSDEIKRLNEELGGIIPDETVQKIADVQEKLEKFFLRLKGMTAQGLDIGFKAVESIGATWAGFIGGLTGSPETVKAASEMMSEIWHPPKRTRDDVKPPIDTEDLEKKKEKTETERAPKQAQIIADALTRAGGGGVAYITPEAKVQVNMAKDIAEIKESLRRQEKTGKNIERKTGWQ